MDVPCEMLLHPELLSNEQLMHIIFQRQLRVPNLDHLPRDQLLEIFHSYCLPFGQRRYRDSGRGKLLNKARHISPEPPSETLNLNRKALRSHIDDRLKPPPDLLTGHMKRIKIETKSVEQIKITNNFKRKISVDVTRPVSESTPPKREKKPITWP